MPEIKDQQWTGYTGSAASGWRACLYIRPMSAADDGQPLIVRRVTVRNVRNCDAIHVATAYEYAKGKYWQFSSVLLEDFEVAGVDRDEAGASARLHCDGLQIRQNGPTQIPVTLSRGVIDTRSKFDAGIIEGSISELTIDQVSTGEGSIKVKPGGANVIPLVRLSGGPRVIAWPGVKVIEWDGDGREPKPTEGAAFELVKKPKVCPTCGQVIP